jgi:hypothetical protein
MAPFSLDERPAGPDHHQVKITRERIPMPIKSILAAAVALAFMIQGSTAIVSAEEIAGTGDGFVMQAKAEDMSEAKTGTKTEVKSEDVPETAAEEQQPITKTRKAIAAVAVRNTRPRTDPHRDARACLGAGNNEAIIRCAEKYR